ncbi:hypothetical protein [Paraburkholderia phytofirmans]
MRGHQVLVEAGAGAAIGMTDGEYVTAGASRAEVRRKCSPART